MASAPWSAARRASSTSMMPFRISLPPHCFLTHSTSAHDRRGVELFVGPRGQRAHVADTLHVADQVPEGMTFACPAMPRHQRGLVARFRMLLQRGPRRRGQAVLQVLVALADHLQVEREHQRAALGCAWCVRSCGPWRRGRASCRAGTRTAPSCVRQCPRCEQMLMVDSVNGMPNFSAARAAWISPSACCMPVRPTGAMHTGIFVSWPTMVHRRAAVFHVHGHALAQLDLLEVAAVGAVGAFGPAAAVGVVVEHARHALFVPARAGLRCW